MENTLLNQEKMSQLHVLDDLMDIVFTLARNEETSPMETYEFVRVVLGQALEDFENGKAEERIDDDILSLRAQILVALNHFGTLGISHGDSIKILEKELVNALRNTLMDRISNIQLPNGTSSAAKNRRASRHVA